MPDDLPASLSSVIARIEPPLAAEAPSSPDITGELARLAAWWQRAGSGLAAQSAIVDPQAPTDVHDAVAAGVTAADRAIDAGATLLVPRCRPRDDVAARSIISLLTRQEASAVLHQPEGLTDREWMIACAAIRDRAAGVADHRGEPLDLLVALDAPGIAHAVGVLLAAAARRTPCLVDGTDELAAALVADRMCHRAHGWWRAGSDSPDPGREAAIDRIGLEAGLPLRLTDDSARGATATLALLTSLQI